MAEGIVVRATARMLERRYVTRTGVTRVGVVVAAIAAVWFSRADVTGAIVGSLFLGLVLFCDTVRSRMRSHRRDVLTLWTISMAVQFREYVVYVGLAFGAAAAGHSGAWGWAAGALIALALRDALLVARAAPPARWAPHPLVLPGQRRPGGLQGASVPRPRDGERPEAPEPERPVDADHAAQIARAAGTPDIGDGGTDVPASPSLVLLTRRVMAFEQPTRFLVIAVAATTWDARIAFIGLIVGCVVAITGELVDPSSEVRR